jgi:hypothetical protein
MFRIFCAGCCLFILFFKPTKGESEHRTLRGGGVGGGRASKEAEKGVKVE